MGAEGLKWGAGLWIFGGARDRFAVYRDLPTFADMLRMARQVPGLAGVELQYPRHFSGETPESVKRLCREAGLEVIGVQPDVFRDPEFRQGALSAPDGAARRRAVDICLEAAEAARRVGAPVLVVWPGQEGFDYVFQADYVAQWERALASLRAIADGAKGLQVAVEYKLKEPRQKSLYGTASQTLAAIQEAGRPNLGVLVDFGHSLIAKESPAQVAALLQRCGKLFHVHLNDCYGETDDDLMVGSAHVFETLELLYYLRRLGYPGWVSLDTVAFREDPLAAAQASGRALERLMAVAGRIRPERLAAVQAAQDGAGAVQFMTELLTGC
jgi:xylose isomerase